MIWNAFYEITAQIKNKSRVVQVKHDVYVLHFNSTKISHGNKTNKVAIPNLHQEGMSIVDRVPQLEGKDRIGPHLPELGP